MKRSTVAERQDHIQNWRSSQMSAMAYCKATGLKYSTFMSWIKKDLGKAKGQKQSGRFLLVHQKSSIVSPVRIIFPNGIRVEMEGGLDRGLIQSLKNA